MNNNHSITLELANPRYEIAAAANVISRPWETRDTFRFLELYREQECLWNPMSRGYRDKDARNAALSNIAKEMRKPHMTPDEIKNKIKCIRTTYKRELIQVMRYASLGAKKPYVPKLSWYNKADEFLQAVSKNNRRSSPPQHHTLSPLQRIQPAAPAVPVKEEIPEPDDDYEDTIPLQEFAFTPGIHYADPVGDSQRYYSETSSTAGQSNGLYQEDNGGDEFSVFGKHVATQLRHMPLATALRCQEKIQSILTQHRIADL